jgi:hypothetical protein
MKLVAAFLVGTAVGVLGLLGLVALLMERVPVTYGTGEKWITLETNDPVNGPRRFRAVRIE